MKYEEMTSNQRARVREDICPLCSKKFTKLDDVEIIRMKYGRAVIYYHFHSKCLLAWRYPSQLAREGVKNAEG